MYTIIKSTVVPARIEDTAGKCEGRGSNSRGPSVRDERGRCSQRRPLPVIKVDLGSVRVII